MSHQLLELESQAAALRNTYSPKLLAQLARLISPVPSCGLMAPAELELMRLTLVSQRRRRAFPDRSIHAATLVLVMCASVAEAAAEVGLTRQVLLSAHVAH